MRYEYFIDGIFRDDGQPLILMRDTISGRTIGGEYVDILADTEEEAIKLINKYNNSKSGQKLMSERFELAKADGVWDE